jgi:hypothetical protein
MFKTFSVLLCALLLWAESSSAAVVLQVDQGKLIGATGVVVDGVSYGVSFSDGSYSSLYGNSEAFLFNTRAKAVLASQALLDQVFLDINGYSFDSSPNLTRGCPIPSYCGAATPYKLTTQDTQVSTVVAVNFDIQNVDAVSGTDLVFDRAQDISGSSWPGNLYTYAVWSPASQSVSSVPEPGALALVMLGVFGLLSRSWRRK